MSCVIGVDIGGTNTDAVLVDEDEKIITFVKTSTTEDISEGFKNALILLLEKASITADQVEGVFVGTTHATNALLQNRDLYKVGIIRIAGHYPSNLPPAFSWPRELKESILIGSETISGGYECHGGKITPFNLKEAEIAIERLLKMGAESIAIIGVFSPLNGEEENQVAKLVQERGGRDFPISLSHEIGGVGFIERENSTLLNAALKKVMQLGFQSLEDAAAKLGIKGKLMITQNDGSLIDLAHGANYPVLTISAGQTNSFIGGAKLAGLDSAIIVDIGGTSTDVGLVQKGFPLRSLRTSHIAGIPLNFSLPDVESLALGGGSLITIKNERPVIHPQSVAKKLKTEAKAFGGDKLTLTDIALACNHLTIIDAKPVPLKKEIANAIFAKVRNTIEKLIFKIPGDLPVVLVGGGTTLLPKTLFPTYKIPAHFDVANAFGAALAEISGSIDTVVSLVDRKQTLAALHEKAKEVATRRGADPSTLRLIEEQIIPYSYAANQMARVIIRFTGKRQKKEN